MDGGGEWLVLAVGRAHACATAESGETRCFGDNAHGQLGDGTLDDAHTPSALPDGGLMKLAAGGRHTCGHTQSGALLCFGDGDHGQLGDARGAFQPGRVASGASVAQWREVAVGGAHACALDELSGLWCWGSNEFSQLGVSGASAAAPVGVSLTGDWSAVSAGARHTCAVRGGEIYCFGANEVGQAGPVNAGSLVASPALAVSDSGWLEVSAGDTHTCAILQVVGAEGSLWCWGANDAGQLGRGAAAVGGHDPIAARVGAEDDWRVVSAGARHTCGLRGGELWCFGDDTSGQLGVGGAGGYEPEPVRVGAARDWIAVASGLHGSCGVRAGGTLWCWGRVGPRDDGATPRQVDDATDWAGVAHGGAAVFAASHVCARKQDGRVSCFGANSMGQLGDGTRLARAQPAAVLGAQGFSALAARGGGGEDGGDQRDEHRWVCGGGVRGGECPCAQWRGRDGDDEWRGKSHRWVQRGAVERECA